MDSAEHSINYWPDTRCARAFWGQQELPAYRRLLADTTAWLDPLPGEPGLDLGCVSGQPTRALCTKSHGRVRQIAGLDCALINEKAYDRLRGAVQPAPASDRIRFVASDFSQ